MSILFERTRIRGMEVSNRFVRSATWEGMATEDGACTPQLSEMMRELAKGRVGLIITGHSYVREDGRAGQRQMGIYKDDFIEDLREMTRAVHEEDGKIVLQLSHAGGFAIPLTGTLPIGPSQVEIPGKPLCREMSVDDIHEIAMTFGKAAWRAVQAGFDGVQLHAAHGYLFSQFLSPYFNKRADAYGGTVKHRAAAFVEAICHVRDAVGKNFPILVKMNSSDYLEGGLTLEDSVGAARLYEEAGIDAVEVSGGTTISGRFSPSRKGITSAEKEAYFRDGSKALKKVLHIPVILVGGLRSFPVAQEIVEQGIADYISMSRPFIREPHLIERWEKGDRRRAACISDSRCFGPAITGEGIYCVVERKGENPETE